MALITNRGNKRKEITQEQIEVFIDMYNDKKSMSQIAKAIDLGSWLLHKLKDSLIQSGEINDRGHINSTWDENKDLTLVSLREKGYTWTEISDIMGVKATTAQNRYNRRTGKINRNVKPKKLWEVEAEARKKGLTYGQYVGGDGHSRI